MRRSEVLWRVSHSVTICGSQIICRQDGIFVWLSFTEEMHEFSLLWTNTVMPIHRRNRLLFFRTHPSKHGDWNYRETLARCRRRTAELFWILFFCLEVLARAKREYKSRWMRRRWSGAWHARALIWDWSDVTAAQASFEDGMKRKIRKKCSFGFVFINCDANEMVEMKW